MSYNGLYSLKSSLIEFTESFLGGNNRIGVITFNSVK